MSTEGVFTQPPNSSAVPSYTLTIFRGLEAFWGGLDWRSARHDWSSKRNTCEMVVTQKLVC